MSQELRDCEMEITQAIGNTKLDAKTSKDDVGKSLDFAGRFPSDNLKKVRFLFTRAATVMRLKG